MTRTATDPSSQPSLDPQDRCTTCHTPETAAAHPTRRPIGRKGRIAIAALCSALLFTAGGIAVAATARDSANGPHEGARVARGEFAGSPTREWTDLPGGSVEFFMPAFHNDLYIARFSASSVCRGKCQIRILIDGKVTSFGGDPDEYFDHGVIGEDLDPAVEAHTIEHSLAVSAGSFGRTVRVVVQYRGDNKFFGLLSWHLTAERVHQTTTVRI